MPFVGVFQDHRSREKHVIAATSGLTDYEDVGVNKCSHEINQQFKQYLIHISVSLHFTLITMISVIIR